MSGNAKVVTMPIQYIPFTDITFKKYIQLSILAPFRDNVTRPHLCSPCVHITEIPDTMVKTTEYLTI